MAFISNTVRMPQQRPFAIAALILCALIAFLAFPPSKHAVAESWIPQFPLKHLEGIDTILVSYEVEDGHRTLLPLYPGTLPPRPSPVAAAIKELFSQQKWLNVYARRDLPAEQRRKPNVIHFLFAVTARQETIGGTIYKTGSIGLQLWKYDAIGKESYAIPFLPVSFPFVVPTTPDEMETILVKGARFLTLHLPSYFAKANRKMDDAPDDPTYKFMHNPFQEE